MIFKDVAKSLASNEKSIFAELNAIQGHPLDLGGYYLPDENLANNAMRPNETFNRIIKSVN